MSKLIKPTVGRVVHYVPSKADHINHNDQPLAAIITYVWNDRMVNLVVFDSNGVPQNRTSVTLSQPDDLHIPFGSYCQWMEYQIGQAALTEAFASNLATATKGESSGQVGLQAGPAGVGA